MLSSGGAPVRYELTAILLRAIDPTGQTGQYDIQRGEDHVHGDHPSSSMIEAWWRVFKHQWLYLNTLDSIATVRKLIGFYVDQHNTVDPSDNTEHGRAGERKGGSAKKRALAMTGKAAGLQSHDRHTRSRSGPLIRKLR